MQKKSIQAHVAAGDPRTAQAGATLLRLGGNAVDAAVGATLAAFCTEPVLTAPFGGGFGMVAGPNLKPVAYDFFADIPGLGLPAVSPETKLDFTGLEVSFGPTTQVFHAGRGAAAMPLLLPGLMQLHAQHGKLDLKDVVAPAMALAQQNMAMSAQIAPIAAILTPILKLTPQTARLFAPNGHVLKAGEPFYSADLPMLLQQFANGDIRALQASLAAHFGAPGGRITQQDIQTATVQTHTPVMIELGPFTVALNPPPSLGGLLVGLGLRLLADIPQKTWQDDTTTFTQLLACMDASQQARVSMLDKAVQGGSTQLQQIAPQFLTPSNIDHFAQSMHRAHHGQHNPLEQSLNPLGSTTHVSAIDTQGLACSITSSNGEGCGHVVPGAGVMANNFLGEEDINPAGFHVRPAGERLTSMMCPTLVMQQNEVVLALGTGGSNRIRTALLQVLVHHLLRGIPLETAIKMPRLHYEGGSLFVERQVFGLHIQENTLQKLAQRVPDMVYFDAPNMFFGGVHAAASHTLGVGDPRRGGHVCVA